MEIDPPVPGADAPMSSEATTPATDMDVEAVDPAGPLPLGGFKIQALRPTVHPPQPRPTGTRIAFLRQPTSLVRLLRVAPISFPMRPPQL